MTAGLMTEEGQVLPLDGRRWFATADAVDRRALRDARGPVLDIGCGPGRHVLALSERSVPTLGIDITPAALVHAQAHGVPVLRRCVFDRVPAAGRWRTALLFDGNIGIGGDPAALLARTRDLLAPDGCVLVEVGADTGASFSGRVTFTIAGSTATHGPWFDWATVTRADLEPLAGETGFRVASCWCDGGRWFAWLAR